MKRLLLWTGVALAFALISAATDHHAEQSPSALGELQIPADCSAITVPSFTQLVLQAQNHKDQLPKLKKFMRSCHEKLLSDQVVGTEFIVPIIVTENRKLLHDLLSAREETVATAEHASKQSLHESHPLTAKKKTFSLTNEHFAIIFNLLFSQRNTDPNDKTREEPADNLYFRFAKPDETLAELLTHVKVEPEAIDEAIRQLKNINLPNPHAYDDSPSIAAALEILLAYKKNPNDFDGETAKQKKRGWLMWSWLKSLFSWNWNRSEPSHVSQ